MIPADRPPRRRWHGLAIQALASLALIGLTAGLGIVLHDLRQKPSGLEISATAEPGAVRDPCAQAQERPYSTNGIEQRPDGALSACLRVGSLSPGRYEIVLETNAKAGLPPAPVNPKAWVRLSPESGPPGTRVNVSGYVPDTTVELQRYDHTRLCWAGCDVLTDLVMIHWSAQEPGRFDTEFTVPSAPWLGADHIQPLTPGVYPVVLECIPNVFDKPRPGCLTTQLATRFRVTGPTSDRCQPGRPCAALVPSPAEAPPGALVRVEGWAPLVGLNGHGYFQLLVQRAGESLPVKPGFERYRSPTIARVPFVVTGPPAWSSLGSLHPLWTLTSGMHPIGPDPVNRKRLAHCTGSSIRLSADGGGTWSTVTVEGVKAASAATNYPVPPPYGQGKVGCNAVALDGKHPGTLYAVFSTTPRDSGPPPFYYTGYVTTDLGRTWKPVPVPDGTDMGRFGGFRSVASGMQALFFLSPSQGGWPPVPEMFAVQQTSDGGQTWSIGRLTCPAAGPCAALGPQTNGRCQAVGQYQSIQLSADGGQSWKASGWPHNLQACWTTELVGLDGNMLALLDGRGQYPLLVSRDGGHSWNSIGLPSPTNGPKDLLPQFPGLQMLPDGSLLTTGDTWQVLTPGASTWCAVRGPSMPPDFVTPAPRLVGDRVWWLESARQWDWPSIPRSLPLRDLHC